MTGAATGDGEVRGVRRRVGAVVVVVRVRVLVREDEVEVGRLATMVASPARVPTPASSTTCSKPSSTSIARSFPFKEEGIALGFTPFVARRFRM